MSSKIEEAIRAVLELTKADLENGNVRPELRELTERAVAAAEKVVGRDEAPGAARRRR